MHNQSKIQLQLNPRWNTVTIVFKADLTTFLSPHQYIHLITAFKLMKLNIIVTIIKQRSVM